MPTPTRNQNDSSWSEIFDDAKLLAGLWLSGLAGWLQDRGLRRTAAWCADVAVWVVYGKDAADFRRRQAETFNSLPDHPQRDAG